MWIKTNQMVQGGITILNIPTVLTQKETLLNTWYVRTGNIIRDNEQNRLFLSFYFLTEKTLDSFQQKVSEIP
jgi:hypothetical protein